MVVAPEGGMEAGESLEDVLRHASAEETVIVPLEVQIEPSEHSEYAGSMTVKVMLAPKLDSAGGGVVWTQVGWHCCFLC